MKDKPILFSTEMVKAILDGRKTVTRRVIKDQDCVEYLQDTGEFIHIHSKDCPSFCDYACHHFSPYRTGQKLWIKQSFQITDYDTNDHTVSGIREDESQFVNIELTDKEWSKFIKWKHPYRKKSKLFMFKSLAYLWLEVTNVRIEILNQISDRDVIAEGFKTREEFYNTIIKLHKCKDLSILEKWFWVYNFKVIYNKLDKWVIEFKRI
jgi:hypothetical protein